MRGLRKQTDLLCGLKDSQESSMDLKGELWFFHYIEKGLKIQLELELPDIQIHT